MKKVGILGFAHGHVFAYGGQWLEHPEYGVEMVAAWDHDRTRLEESAPKLKIGTLCGSAEELLALDFAEDKTEVDADYISTILEVIEEREKATWRTQALLIRRDKM